MTIWKYTFIVLIMILALVGIAILQLPDSNLHLIACNVGQGDATLVIHKNYQVLIDGGPDSKVLDCLGKYLPFWDRELELVILTHPDKDHFQGLIEVVRRYKVDNYLSNTITISKPEYKVLEKEVGSRGITTLSPHEGQVLKAGMIYLDILDPLGNLPTNEGGQSEELEIAEGKTNELSIASLVSFGKFNAILTGDMTQDASDGLATRWNKGTVNYIKIPHHGSRNGLTINLLKVLRPNTATISVGKNSYGHPHDEIIKMLSDQDIEVYRTDEIGNIEVVSNGEGYWIENNM